MSAILDSTNPEALQYFTGKLDSLKKRHRIDSFKFDAGESSFLPREFSLFDKKATLATFSQNYVKMAADQSKYVEVRTGTRLQKVGVFYRILDRGSWWEIENGLRSVIPAVLHFGILG